MQPAWFTMSFCWVLCQLHELQSCEWPLDEVLVPIAETPFGLVPLARFLHLRFPQDLLLCGVHLACFALFLVLYETVGLAGSGGCGSCHNPLV